MQDSQPGTTSFKVRYSTNWAYRTDSPANHHDSPANHQTINLEGKSVPDAGFDCVEV